MKLTNTIRDAFISAAMQDVPSVDYVEQAQSLAKKTLDAMFAKTFGAIKIEDAAPWLNKTSARMPGSLRHFYGYTPGFHAIENDPKVWAKLVDLEAKHRKQCSEREDLSRKLKAVAYSVTTRKALVDALPEFEKYLPADNAAACRQLPVVANVVTEFVKAGWPKGKKA